VNSGTTSDGDSAHIYAEPDVLNLVLTDNSRHTPAAVSPRDDDEEQSYQQQQQLDPARITVDAVVQRGVIFIYLFYLFICLQ